MIGSHFIFYLYGSESPLMCKYGKQNCRNETTNMPGFTIIIFFFTYRAYIWLKRPLEYMNLVNFIEMTKIKYAIFSTMYQIINSLQCARPLSVLSLMAL